MKLALLLHALLHAFAAAAVSSPAAVQMAQMTPQQKAAAVVVSGLPAPPGAFGVIVPRPWGPGWALPRGAVVFADQEGGLVKALPGLPPWEEASSFASAGPAFLSGRDTGRALRRSGVDVDLAPVLDASDGPLGSRAFASPPFGVAFGRGLAAGGAGACAKHFPGLGSTAVSTDDRPHVDGVLRPAEIAGFRAAIRAGVPCVMVDNAFYARFGAYRASIAPAAYRLLRSLGFQGVAITDSLSIVHRPPARWARQASLAGADLLLYTDPKDAAQAIRTLLPLARAGRLDAHVVRVLRWRNALVARR